MHETLLTELVSPVNRKSLQLEIFERGSLGEGPEQILSGRLFNDDEEFPVIKGVPRLLNQELLANALSKYSEFWKEYGSRFSKLSVDSNIQADPLLKKTQDSFGKQWNLFKEMYSEWKHHFLDFLSPFIELSDFKDQRVLDCGCGFGRHLFYVAEAGAKTAIGADLSHAVDAAAANLAAFPNAHVVQANIYQLPFVNQFDISYSVGVLQHTPDAKKAFIKVSELAKEGGVAYAWIYGKRPLSYRATVDLLRHVTVNMNPKQLYYLCWILAVITFGGLAMPRRLLDSIGLERLGKLVPFSRYADYPFRASHADWYDRLAAPRTDYFSEEEALEILNAVSAKEKEIKYREGGSWKLYAKK